MRRTLATLGAPAWDDEQERGVHADNDGRHVIVATADSCNNVSGSQDEAFCFGVPVA